MMKKSELMLFALLRSSLHEQEVEQVFFDQATDEDWKQCHQIAAAQGVMALAWDGVLRLPKSEQVTRFFLSFQFFSSTDTFVEKLTF
jgi:hypothetical protein